ncbi:delta-1-pyrroline-5-carboxylate dehydrogenase PrnC [Glomus cerebriforme]|uniref:Multifunctional fusion protein n=1 Tax=Glomus cerebriforme TaxID=658196 RepID=A0A397SWX4_9GLOM|nr:delta-1-pyrroline-5-carboxylate dehydrogenase PrnC [Glomus cerebriforme]RIA90548.1 delta-1-pyrroline-5-carboxylate dehydrogenase PrnC [Glomus cerebriforme]
MSTNAAHATLGTFKLPEINNEPMRNYEPGSADRMKLQAALKELKAQAPIEIPVFVNGEKISTGKFQEQRIPSDHRTILAKAHEADTSIVEKAIKGALAAQSTWETYPFSDRSAIFLKAADLAAGKYRYKLLAATMLGQGKNTWQAEIDSAAELIDFWRFNNKYANEIYQQQPSKNSPGVWNRVEYRPLEGFVYAITPFNFTAIGGNLPSAPALMGNVVLWKPSPNALLSNWVIMEILREAGLPDGVIQFIPGPAQELTDSILKSPDFTSLHFTGSTYVFKKLWKEIGNNIDIYKSYPRIVGETGGKNFHLIHKSANVQNAVHQTIRGAFEYQGQKCSACSRAYVPDSLWDEFRELLLQKLSTIKIGSPEDFSNFMGAVIHEASFEKVKGYIDWAAKDADSEIIAGGTYDKSKGYFINPTVIVTKNPKSKTMVEEIFGPVLTIYVYKADEYEQTLELANKTTDYALTGSIFAEDRSTIINSENKLRHASGNFYINDKSTGAIVGQQPFGGSRSSGTNDKAGSPSLLYRFVSTRTIKENFINIDDHLYPSNLV